MHVPLPLLGQLTSRPFDWQIPGLRLELVTALIRGLPKALRRSLIPAPDRAADVLARVGPQDGPLLDVVGAALEDLTGTRIGPDDWAPQSLPAHLRVTFRVEDERGRTLGEGHDLPALQAELRPKLREAIARRPDSIERTGLRAWDLDVLPREHRTVVDGHEVTGFPALVDEGDSVAVRVLTTRDEADAAHAAGLRRLLRLTSRSPVPYVLSQLSNASKLVLSRAKHATRDRAGRRLHGRRRRRARRRGRGRRRCARPGRVRDPAPDTSPAVWTCAPWTWSSGSRRCWPRRTTCRPGCAGRRPWSCCLR